MLVGSGPALDLSSIDVFVGGLLGVMLVFVFSSLTIRAVGSAGSKIIEEVRRQFRENPGIMQGTVRPDYARAVDITAREVIYRGRPHLIGFITDMSEKKHLEEIFMERVGGRAVEGKGA